MYRGGGVKMMEWTPPVDGIAVCQIGGVNNAKRKEKVFMGEVTIIEIDLANRSFQLHGARTGGSVVFRKKLSRESLMKFLAAQPRRARRPDVLDANLVA